MYTTLTIIVSFVSFNYKVALSLYVPVCVSVSRYPCITVSVSTCVRMFMPLVSVSTCVRMFMPLVSVSTCVRISLCVLSYKVLV